jgi:hypothetical protein
MFNTSLNQFACALACATLFAIPASAHGVLGDRFFPATITSDDPFAADELALPTFSAFRRSDGGTAMNEQDYDFEWSKSIVPGFAISFAGGYIDTPSGKGFDNLEITPVAEVIRDPDREFILSAGVSFDIDGSGSRAVTDSFTIYTPEVLFGKGFGGLPDSMALLRPFAVTGTLGYAIPAASGASRSVEWAGALEYSLLYLQNNVRDQGFGKFAAQLTPIVEFSMETPTDMGGGGTTGTIDPGLLWSGQYEQLGVEAIIPVNRATGRNVGVVAQLHFYIDDMFPDTFGRPLFGGAR